MWFAGEKTPAMAAFLLKLKEDQQGRKKTPAMAAFLLKLKEDQQGRNDFRILILIWEDYQLGDVFPHLITKQ